MKFIRVTVTGGSESLDGEDLLVNPVAIAHLTSGCKHREFIVAMVNSEDDLHGCVVTIGQMQIDYLTGEGL